MIGFLLFFQCCMKFPWRPLYQAVQDAMSLKILSNKTLIRKKNKNHHFTFPSAKKTVSKTKLGQISLHPGFLLLLYFHLMFTNTCLLPLEILFLLKYVRGKKSPQWLLCQKLMLMSYIAILTQPNLSIYLLNRLS